MYLLRESTLPQGQVILDWIWHKIQIDIFCSLQAADIFFFPTATEISIPFNTRFMLYVHAPKGYLPGKHRELEEQFLHRTKCTSVDISLLAFTQSGWAPTNFCPILTVKVQVHVTMKLSYCPTEENHFPICIFSHILPLIGLHQLV